MSVRIAKCRDLCHVMDPALKCFVYKQTLNRNYTPPPLPGRIMPINKILQPIDVNTTPRREATKCSHGRTASVPSTPPPPLPLSPSCRKTWENTIPTWTNEASLAGAEWRSAHAKRQASNSSTSSTASSYEPEIPSNPKYWMPQHVASYVTSCLVNVNKAPSSSPTRPNYFVQDLARYIKNEARWTGSQFLRLHEQDLVDRGMSEVWRKIVMDTVRQCRRERLRGRVLGSDPGSFYENVEQDDDTMSVMTSTTYETTCETMPSENGEDSDQREGDYFGLGIQGTLHQQTDGEVYARKDDVDLLGQDIDFSNHKVKRLQERIDVTAKKVEDINEAVTTMTASQGSYATKDDLESLRRQVLSEISKLAMPPPPKPEPTSAPSSSPSSRQTHHRSSSEAAAIYARRVSTTVASTASKAADLAVSNSLFTFSSIALFAIVALSFTQHESRTTSVNHFLQARR